MNRADLVGARETGSLRTRLAVGVPVTGILASELFVYAGANGYALWGYLITLLTLTLAPLGFPDQLSTSLAFVLLPVFRLVNLGMPAFVDTTLFWLPFVYVPIVPAAVLIVGASDAVEIDFGWKRALMGVPVIVPLAGVLGEAGYRLLRPDPLAPTLAEVGPVVVFVAIAVVFVAGVEELLFRGILQQTLQGRLGRWSGLALAGGVFAVMHVGYATLSAVGFAFGLGLLLGYLYDRTESFGAIVLVHGLTNVLVFGVIPIRGSLLVYLLG